MIAGKTLMCGGTRHTATGPSLPINSSKQQLSWVFILMVTKVQVLFVKYCMYGRIFKEKKNRAWKMKQAFQLPTAVELWSTITVIQQRMHLFSLFRASHCFTHSIYSRRHGINSVYVHILHQRACGALQQLCADVCERRFQLVNLWPLSHADLCGHS